MDSHLNQWHVIFKASSCTTTPITISLLTAFRSEAGTDVLFVFIVRLGSFCCLPFSSPSPFRKFCLHVSFRNTTLKGIRSALWHPNFLLIEFNTEVSCSLQIQDATILQFIGILREVHGRVAQVDIGKDILDMLWQFLIVGLFITVHVERK